MKTTLFLTPLYAALFFVLGCAPKASESSVFAHRDLVADTDIFLGSDQYQVQSRDEASAPSSKKSKAQAPVDVDYILTKSKDISVGVSTEASGLRAQKEETSFVPASATKIITTAVALRELGADFRFKTRIGFDLGTPGEATNVVIVADGDPTAGLNLPVAGAPLRLQEIVQALKSRGVREVTGSVRLVSADPRLDAASLAEGVPLEDARECYGALSMAFNFQANCALARVNAQSGFAWADAGAGDSVSTSIETVAGEKASARVEAVLSADRGLRGYRLTGTYSQTPKVMQLRLPVGNAAMWFGQSLLSTLSDSQISTARAGIKIVTGSQERAAALGDLARQSSVAIESAPLSAIIEATNKPSDNFLADSIFKAIGLHAGSGGRLTGAGRTKVKETLGHWLRADGHAAWASDFELYEGAGLSANNRATPRAFLAVLRRLSQEPTFPQLWQSLPIAGVDGTLIDRMKDTIATGHVRAKTGTLKGSYQLVGYIPRSRGSNTEYIPFVILTSTNERNRDLVRRFQDAVVIKMMESVSNEAR